MERRPGGKLLTIGAARPLQKRVREVKFMARNNPNKPIQHILCPTDLSANSQKTLGFASRLAEDLSAQLTACHVQRAQWFSSEIETRGDNREIEAQMKCPLLRCGRSSDSSLKWRTSIIENSFDPSRDILNLARETDVDLIVMKARPGVMSAFRFGSIVERVVAAAHCPVLIFPTRFIETHEPDTAELPFERILFDYDFSQATDELYQFVTNLSAGLSAQLHVLSVLEPPVAGSPEFAAVANSRGLLQRVIEQKLDNVVAAVGPANCQVQASVEWGDHAKTVLNYASSHKADLICTTLSRPHFSYEKYYSVYLGQLLRAATCPILVKQSV